MVGRDKHRIMEEAFRILDGKTKQGRIPEGWDGKAAERIIDVFQGQADQ